MELQTASSLKKIRTSYLTLPKDSNIKRLPRAPKRKRKQEFWNKFDAHTLIYDVFWKNSQTTKGDRQVVITCPPPVNLEKYWQEASFSALPSKKKLQIKRHILRSTMTIVLKDVPANSEQIELTFADKKYILDIQENHFDIFENSNLLFTMSKNNPLSWIKEWATYHQKIHDTNAIIFFDNGSDIYEIKDIEQVLKNVSGIKTVAVIALNHKYGPHDPKVISYRFWANFLQISSFSIMFRRFGGKANAILNCDIDEFIAPINGSNIYEEAKKSNNGIFILNGLWVEGITKTKNNPPIHTDFTYMLRDFRKKLNANKWAIDPSQKWLQDIKAHPAVHRIRNVPKIYAKTAPKGIFWHFKGINTNWKENRNKNKKPIKFLYFQSDKLKKTFENYQNSIKK